jgi:DNA-binding NarL/FixJ family response regulator
VTTATYSSTFTGARRGTLHREISEDDLQLLRLLSTGLPVEAVARRLDLSERTVRRRTRSACDRLGFGTAVEAIVWAARRGLL